MNLIARIIFVHLTAGVTNRTSCRLEKGAASLKTLFEDVAKPLGNREVEEGKSPFFNRL